MSQRDARRANEQRRELEVEQRRHRNIFEDPVALEELKKAEQIIKKECGKGKIVIEINVEEGSKFHSSYTKNL